MRILVTGAYGLIGSAVLARLHRDGHELIGTGRAIDEARRRFPYVHWIEADYARLTTPQAWQPLLVDIDAVVNCVGVLQDGARDDVHSIQVEGTGALFDACATGVVRRVVHLSAIGAATTAPTTFARTKAEAELHLTRLDLDWVILRPGLVLGPSVHGGSAMLRGLAGMPFALPLIEADSRIQVVSIGDVVDTVALCVSQNAMAKRTWDIAHPDAVLLREIVVATRQWLGFRPLPSLRLPAFVSSLVAVIADGLGWLGWRSPARSTAMAQLAHDVIGDPSTWTAATGIRPQNLSAILAGAPANVADRWFARLYWLKPIAILFLAVFWIGTGVVALGPGRAAASLHLTQAGMGPGMAEFTLVVGSIFDIVLGLALCVRRFTRPVLLIMLAATSLYLLVGTITAPQLWLDPLGPYLKIIPMLLATAFTLAILDER